MIGSLKDSNGEKYVGVKLHWNIEHIKNEKGEDDILTHLFWEQSDLTAKYVEEFKQVLKERTNRYLKKRKTPAPATDVPVIETREKSEQRAKDSAANEKRKELGVFASDHASWVNKLAYVKDHTRGELSVAILELQCVGEANSSNPWTSYHDKKLIWAYGFLDATTDWGLNGIISRLELERNEVWLLVQSDASHASVRETRKGILGFCIRLRGHYTNVCLAQGATTCKKVTLSSCETELCAAQIATLKAMVLKMLIDVLTSRAGLDMKETFEGGLPSVLEMDAKSAIAAVVKGGSSSVRHVRRTVGISIYFLYESWVLSKNNTLKHRVGTELPADLFTKDLSEDSFLKHCKELLYGEQHKDVQTAKDVNDSKAGTTNENEAGASKDTKGKAGTTAGARETPAGAKKPIFQPPSGWVPDGHNLHGDPVLKEHFAKMRAQERAARHEDA